MCVCVTKMSVKQRENCVNNRVIERGKINIVCSSHLLFDYYYYLFNS